MANQHPPELRAKVVEAYAAEPAKSLDDLAAEFRVNRSTVAKWAAAAGLPRRPTGRKKTSAPRPFREKRGRAKTIVRDESPVALKATEGEWVYGDNGIARWYPYVGKK